MAKVLSRHSTTIQNTITNFFFRIFVQSSFSYFYEDERGLFPEVQFVFDLEVPEDFTPENADREVESFQLYPIEDVRIKTKHPLPWCKDLCLRLG